MKTIKAAVKITVGDKKEEVPYEKKQAETLEEALTLVEGKTQEEKLAAVLKDFNYGNDLRVKSNVRRKWEQEHEDPEKAIKKAADALVVAIPGLSFENARAAIIAQRKEAETAAQKQ